MDVIRQCKEREISRVIDPTVAAFVPLLKKRKAYIQEIPVKTFRYATGDRGELDIYYPPPPSQTPTQFHPKTPILLYLYGGGFNTGERSISPKSFGLVYANVGAYFARKGFIVVIPDYRLVPHVVFPGPAEDIRDALRWLLINEAHLASDGSPHPDVENVIMMGHSAGAAHLATMLFHPDVLADEPTRSKIKAAIFQSPPFDLSAMTMDWPSAAVHAKYWLTLERAKDQDPLHLYQRLDRAFAIEKLPRMLMVEGEFEPDWLIDAGNVFHDQVEETTGEDLRVLVAKGHNHVSLNWALSTGEGEEWAEAVVEWIRQGIRALD